VGSAEIPSGGRSPLAKFFAHVDPPAATGPVESSLRRVETILDDLRDLPVHRLKDEMRELQVCSFRVFSLSGARFLLIAVGAAGAH
jgi:hypothetical protein